jgi:hypothetical protein
VRLARRDRKALELAAEGRPIYRCGDGPHILCGDGSWLRVVPATIDTLVQAGLIVWTGSYWLITDAGRAEVSDRARD